MPYRDESERLAASIKYPIPVTLFSPKSNAPSFWPFNSVKFLFSPSANTPTSSANGNMAFYTVEVYLTQTDALLEGSISHNFAKASASIPVKCQFVSYSKKLVCVNVAPLLQTTTYFVAAKIAFLSSALPSQQNFGQITVKL